MSFLCNEPMLKGCICVGCGSSKGASNAYRQGGRDGLHTLKCP